MNIVKEKQYKFVSTSAATIEAVAKPGLKHYKSLALEGS